MAEKLKTPDRIAELICGSGQCICSYKCGHSNKAPIAEKLPLIGTNTVCPLARYNVEPDTRPWYSLSVEEMRDRQLTEDDCWRFCGSCPHSERVERDGEEYIHLKDFETVCIDCPVKAVLDNISEGMAEAGMS